MGSVEQRELTVEGRPARVHVGGDGPALLLVHGGWAGAAAHWSTIWERLAPRYRVIAPDLPGLGWTGQPALGTYREYARWLAALLDTLDVERAWCVGNSFGASVAWCFAGLFPERCRGVVMVNGIPVPRTPAPMLWLGRRPFGRGVMRALLKRVSYTPAALERAFVDPGRVPEEIRAVLSQPAPPQLDAFARVLVEGDGGPAPRVAPLLLWGEADQLPGSGAGAARKLHAKLPGSRLTLIPKAGHFPQVDQPDLFVEALSSFASER
ncbi:MAG TPA: alpha/beta hydrolase [Myxococcaceae bacterium]|nr:alpha/beta hydrolase [Myxococcaceae bacterium]